MASYRAVALSLAFAIGVVGCLEPTEAIVEISTDASCDGVSGTGITAGLLGEIEAAPYGTTTDACNAGDIGSIVLLPGEDDEDDSAFAFKVVTGLGVPAESCVAPDYGPACIVARRAMRFVPHEPFHVPVRMAQACAGVLCPPEQTCVDGTCQSAACPEAGGCEPEPGTPPPFVKQFGGPGNQMARAVAFRNSTLLLAGNFDDAIDLGGGPLQSQGSQDAFLAAFTPGGVHRWSTSFGGPGLDEAISVAIGAGSDVYLMATFTEGIDLGGGLLTSAGGTDIVLARYKSWGKLVWSQRLGGEGGDAPGTVVEGADGNVYVVGSFTDAAAFGDVQISAAGGSDAFVASFTAAGTVRWAKAIGGSGDDGANGVGVDDAGSVFVGGYFEGEASAPAVDPIVAVGTADAFVASFADDGTARWVKSFGAKGRDLVLGLTATQGRVVATGVLANAATYDGKVLDAKNQDGFVLSLDSEGTLEWARIVGSDGSDQGESVSLADDGSVTVAGQIFHGSAFDSDEVDLGGVRNPFVVVLERDGEPRWAHAYASAMYAGSPAVAAAPAGFAYVAGWFVDDLQVGEELLESQGAEDALLVRTTAP